MFQSNASEKKQLLELVEDYSFAENPSLEQFRLDVIDVAKPVNIDHDQLAKLLGTLIAAGNKSRARKLIDASISDERLGEGPKKFAYVLFFPILFLVGIIVVTLRIPYRWCGWLFQAPARWFKRVFKAL